MSMTSFLYPDGTTLISTLKGLYTYNPYDNSLSEIENIGSVITSLEAEDESNIWMGTVGQGVIRYNLSNESRSQVTTTNGLISDEIADLALDKEKGYLWVATDLGLSRLSIGYKLTSNTNSTITVFPNPFCRSRHSEIYFRNLPPNSKVTIRAVDGGLVAKAKLVRGGNDGAYYSWKPPSKIVPGTYLYSVSSEGQPSKAGKILISP